MKNSFPLLYGRILSGLLSVSLALPPPAWALRSEAVPEGIIAGTLAADLLKLSAGLEEPSPSARTAEFLATALKAYRGFGFINWRDQADYPANAGPEFISQFAQQALESGLIPKIDIRGIDDTLSLQALSQLRTKNQNAVVGVAIYEAAQVPSVVSSAQGRNLIISAPVSIIGEVVLETEKTGVNNQILVIAKVRNWTEVEAAKPTGAQGIEVEPAAGQGMPAGETAALLERIAGDAAFSHIRVWGSAGGVNVENASVLMAKGYVGFSIGPRTLEPKLQWFNASKQQTQNISGPTPEPGPAAGEEERLRVALSAEIQPPFWLRVGEARKLLTVLLERGEPARIGYTDPDNPGATPKTVEIRVEKNRILARYHDQDAWWQLPLESRSFFFIHPDRTVTFYPVLRQGKNFAPAFREARKSARKLSLRMLNQLLATASQEALPENIHIDEAVHKILEATSSTPPKVTEVVFMQPAGKHSRMKGPHFSEQKVWSKAMTVQQGGWLQLAIDETRQTAVLSPPIEYSHSAGQEEASDSGRYVDQVRTAVQKQLLEGFDSQSGLRVFVDFDGGFRRSTTGTILNPHWALVKGSEKDWWIHLHVYYDMTRPLDYYRQHGVPQRVIRNGLLFKLLLSENGRIQGLSDAMAERGEALAPRGFVPVAELIPEKEYRWLVDSAHEKIRPYAKKLEEAITQQKWKFSLLETVSPPDAVGIYEMWSSKADSSNVVLRSKDIAITFRRLDPQGAPFSAGLEEKSYPVETLGNRALPAVLAERTGSLNPSEAGDLLLLFVSGEGLVSPFDAQPWVGPKPADSYSFPVDQLNPYAYVYNTPDPISISITPVSRELVRGLLQGAYDLHLLVEALRRRFGEDPQAAPSALQGELIQRMLTTPERFHKLLDKSASGFVQVPDRLFRVKGLPSGTEEVLNRGHIKELEEWLALQVPAWRAEGTNAIRVRFPKGALVNSVNYSLEMGLTAGQVASDIVEVVTNYGAPDVLFEVVRATPSATIELRPAGTEEVEQKWRKYVSALSATTGINPMIQRIRRTQQLEDNAVPPLPDVGLVRWEFVLALKQAGFSAKETLFAEFMRRAAEEKLRVSDQERNWIWEAIHGAFQGGLEELSFDNALVKILLYVQEKNKAGEMPRLQFFNGSDPKTRSGMTGDTITTEEIRQELRTVADLSENSLVTAQVETFRSTGAEVLSIAPAIRQSAAGLEEPLFPPTLKPVPFDNAFAKKLGGWLNNTRLQVGSGSLDGQAEAILQYVKKYEEAAAESDFLAFHTFQVSPIRETFSRFPWLAVLNKQPPSAVHPEAGSFGQIVLNEFQTEEGQPALLIEEIQPSSGYRELKDNRRHQLDGWRRKAVEAIAQTAAANGHLVFAASGEVLHYANITAPFSLYETRKNYAEPYDPAVWENQVLIVEDSDLYRHPSRSTGERLAWHAFKENPKLRIASEGIFGALFGQSLGRTLNNRFFPPVLNEPVRWPVRGVPLPKQMQFFWDRYFPENPPVFKETTADLMLTTVGLATPFIKEKHVLEIGTGYGYVVSAAVEVVGANRGVGTDIQGTYLAKGREAVARLDLSDRVSLLEGDLFTPVQGQSFDVVLSNTANLEMADRFIRSVGTVLAPDGVAFLLPWDNSILGEGAFASPNLDPKRFQKAAGRVGLVLQPVLAGPGNVKIYALARDRKRLELVRKIFENGAGMEEGFLGTFDAAELPKQMAKALYSEVDDTLMKSSPSEDKHVEAVQVILLNESTTISRKTGFVIPLHPQETTPEFWDDRFEEALAKIGIQSEAWSVRINRSTNTAGDLMVFFHLTPSAAKLEKNVLRRINVLDRVAQQAMLLLTNLQPDLTEKNAQLPRDILRTDPEIRRLFQEAGLRSSHLLELIEADQAGVSAAFSSRQMTFLRVLPDVLDILRFRYARGLSLNANLVLDETDEALWASQSAEIPVVDALAFIERITRLVTSSGLEELDTLKDGTTAPKITVKVVMTALPMLMAQSPMLFETYVSEVKKTAAQPKFSGKNKDILRSLALVQPDGTVDEATCRIVRLAVSGGDDLPWQIADSPLKEPDSPPSGLEEPIALFNKAQEQTDGFQSVSPADSRWVVVIGKGLAEKFPGLQIFAHLWSRRIVIDRGDAADTLTRAAERGDAVHFYGDPEEASRLDRMAKLARMEFVPHDPAGRSFTLLIQEILKNLGVPSEVISSGLEDFSDDLQALGAAA